MLAPAIAFAHPGKTDKNGGHTDKSTGEYHYHHGYEAHQHDGDVCPLDPEWKPAGAITEITQNSTISAAPTTVTPDTTSNPTISATPTIIIDDATPTAAPEISIAPTASPSAITQPLFTEKPYAKLNSIAAGGLIAALIIVGAAVNGRKKRK
jgi:hypothetical protein